MLLSIAFAYTLLLNITQPGLALVPLPNATLNYTVPLFAPVAQGTFSHGYEYGVFEKIYSFNTSLSQEMKNVALLINRSYLSCSRGFLAYYNGSFHEPKTAGNLLVLNFSSLNSGKNITLLCNASFENKKLDYVGLSTWELKNISLIFDSGSSLVIGYVVSGFSFKGARDKSNVHAIEANGTGVFYVTDTTLYYYVPGGSETLVSYFTVENASFFDLAYDENRSYLAVLVSNSTYANLTILNSTFDIVNTTALNSSLALEFADINGDGSRELIACANLTRGFRLYSLNFTSEGYADSWKDLGIPCNFTSLARINITGYNESLVALNRSRVLLILFNSSNYTVDLGINASSLARFSFNSSFLALTNGFVKLYNVSSSGNLTFLDTVAGGRISTIVSCWNCSKAYLYFLDGGGVIRWFEFSGKFPDHGYMLLPYSNAVAELIEFNLTECGNVNVSVFNGSAWYNESFSSQVPFSAELEAYLTGDVNITFEISSSCEPYLYLDIFSSVLGFESEKNITYAKKILELKPKTNIWGLSKLKIAWVNFTGNASIDQALIWLDSSTNITVNSSLHEIDIERIEPSKIYEFQLNRSKYASFDYGFVLSNSSGLLVYTNESNITSLSYFIRVPGLKSYCTSKNLIGAINDSGFYLFKANSSSYLLLGNFSEENFSFCFIGENISLVGNCKVYVLNSSLSLNALFLNSSFCVEEVAEFVDEFWGFNGTHAARLKFDNTTSELNKSQGLWVSKDKYLRSTTYYLDFSNPTFSWHEIAFDFANKFVRRLSSVFFFLGRSTELFSSFKNYLLAGLELFRLEFTEMTSDFELNSNVTHANSWVGGNYSSTLQINLTSLGYVFNKTESEISYYEVFCTNGTDVLSFNLTKASNYTYSANVLLGIKGILNCSAIPVWKVDFSNFFKPLSFVIYSDYDWPVIKSVELPNEGNISALHAYNISVAVEENTTVYNVSLENENVSLLSWSFNGTHVIVTLNYTEDVSNFETNVSLRIFDAGLKTNETNITLKVWNSTPPLISFDLIGGKINFVEAWINVSTSPVSDAPFTYTLYLYNSTGALNQSSSYSAKVVHNFTASAGIWYVNASIEDITGLASSSETIKLARLNSKEHEVKFYKLGDSATITFNFSKEFEGEVLKNSANGSSPSSLKLKVPHGSDSLHAFDAYIKMSAGSNKPYAIFFFDNVHESDLPTEIYYKIEGDNPQYFAFNTSKSISKAEICLFADVSSSTYAILQKCTGISSASDCHNTTIKAYSDKYLCYSSTLSSGSYWFRLKYFARETEEEESTGTGGTAVPQPKLSISGVSSIEVNVNDCKSVSFTVSNTGNAQANITKIELSGFPSGLVTRISPSSLPWKINAGSSSTLTLRICPSQEGTWSGQIKLYSGSTLLTSKSLTVKATVSTTQEQGTTTQENQTQVQENETEVVGNKTEELNISYEIENEFVELKIMLGSKPVEEAKVSIIYPNGEAENYTITNGTLKFKPKFKEFSIKVWRGSELVGEKSIEVAEEIGKKREAGILGILFRIFFDLLVLGALLAIGIFLDMRL